MQPPCGMWAHFPSNLAISLSILGPLLVNIQVPQCSFPAWPPLGLSVMTWINLWQAHCLLVNPTLTDSTRTQCLRPAQECWSVSEITALRSSGRIPVKHHIVRPARRDAYSLRVQPGVGGAPLLASPWLLTRWGKLSLGAWSLCPEPSEFCDVSGGWNPPAKVDPPSPFSCLGRSFWPVFPGEGSSKVGIDPVQRHTGQWAAGGGVSVTSTAQRLRRSSGTQRVGTSGS